MPKIEKKQILVEILSENRLRDVFVSCVFLFILFMPLKGAIK